MSSRINFEVIAPEGIKFRESVWEIMVPSVDGQIGLLPHHTPLICLVVAGLILIRLQPDDPVENWEPLATSGGLLEVTAERVRLLADTAERAEDIDELRAKEALQWAQELKRTAADHVALAGAARLIERNLIRLKVAELRRHRHRPKGKTASGD